MMLHEVLNKYQKNNFVKLYKQQKAMTVLLSIKPEFANKIFEGTKKYEYRKSIFKRSGINKIIVYASSPIKKVIGEFSIECILNDKVDVIWEETSVFSGVSKKFYLSYFENRDNAYAIKIGEVTKYENARELKDYNINMPPQSFIYIDV